MKQTLLEETMKQPFKYNDRVIWDSGYSYEIGYYLGENEGGVGVAIDVITGLIN
jgi:hypothetical protein